MSGDRSRIFDPSHPFLIVRRNAASVAILKDALLNVQLSFKARGLLGALLCLPEGATLRFDRVLKLSEVDGRDAIRSGLRDLQRAGHLEIVQERDGSGRFGRTVWYVSDASPMALEVSQTPRRGIPGSGKSVSGEKARGTGFPFSVDPPCSSSSLESKTTTTTPAANEISGLASGEQAQSIDAITFPPQLVSMNRDLVTRMVQPCPEAAQALLDELAGAMECGAVKSSPAGYLRSLVKAQMDGKFQPDRGLAIARRRAKDMQSPLPAPSLGARGLEIARKNLREIGELWSKAT